MSIYNVFMKCETIFINALNRAITFYVGTNKLENDQVLDMGAPDDLWFHAHEVSSCHIVASIPDDIVINKNMRYIITLFNISNADFTA